MTAQPPQLAESALIAQARTGRHEPFVELLSRHQDRLFNTLYRMTGNYDDAAEILQEASLRAFRSLRTFQGKSTFYTWFFSIAHNLLVSRKRHRTPLSLSAAHFPSSRDSDSEETDSIHLPDNRSDPVRVLTERERFIRIHQAIQSLDAELRAVVVLRDIDGMSYEEIAGVLGLAVGTVKSRIHRARVALRQCLADLLE